MTRYERLSIKERESIKEGLLLGKGQTEIAKELSRNKSTICRELKRLGFSKEQYSPSSADADCKSKQSSRRFGKRKIKGNLATQIENLLKKRFSPEQTSQKLRKQFSNDPLMRVSHEAIYQYIYAQKDNGKRKQLIQYLRRRKKYRRRRFHRNTTQGVLRNMTSIHERPEAVEKREEIGHWEGDLIIGAGHGSAMLTLVERALRYTMIVPLGGDMTAKAVLNACLQRLGPLPVELRKSLTYDRGKEMAMHETLTLLTGIKVYFADPRAPWQRGTNENTNGLIRDFFPKGTDFSRHSSDEIMAVEELLNIRPRKVLKFESPAALMYKYYENMSTRL